MQQYTSPVAQSPYQSSFPRLKDMLEGWWTPTRSFAMLERPASVMKKPSNNWIMKLKLYRLGSNQATCFQVLPAVAIAAAAWAARSASSPVTGASPSMKSSSNAESRRPPSASCSRRGGAGCTYGLHVWVQLENNTPILNISSRSELV